MVILPDYYAGKMINPMTSSKEELVAFVQNETQWEGGLEKTWCQFYKHFTRVIYSCSHIS
jgi:hypothetical protein